jgi:hypothetical protein
VQVIQTLSQAGEDKAADAIASKSVLLSYRRNSHENQIDLINLALKTESSVFAFHDSGVNRIGSCPFLQNRILQNRILLNEKLRNGTAHEITPAGNYIQPASNDLFTIPRDILSYPGFLWIWILKNGYLKNFPQYDTIPPIIDTSHGKFRTTADIIMLT